MSDFRVASTLVTIAVTLVPFVLPESATAQPGCGPLAPATGVVIDVTPAQVASLQGILDAAQAGYTIQLADGLYSLPQTLVLRKNGVTLRSKSGNRDGVVLDGGYAIGDVLLVQKSNITIADLTVTRANWHLVHVVPDGGSSSGTLLHNIRARDGSEQFVKVNPANGQHADNGVLRCSLLEMTDTGRAFIRNNCYTGGVDLHQARGWQIAGNILSGFWCSSGLAEHAIHAWTGSRDTQIDRNVVINSARGIGLGLGSAVNGRTYSDLPCGGAPNVGHFGGAITNNFVVANDARLFGSAAGFDVGIGLEQSCQTNVLHNTVVSTAPPRSSSIEWRFPNTIAVVANNLASAAVLERDAARATVAGNVTNAPLSWFVDVTTSNVHLLPTAAGAINKAVALSTPLVSDIDLEARGAAADVGADEFGGAIPPPPPDPAGASATFVRADATTQGAWKGGYGKDGYAIAGDVTRLPSYAQMSVTGAAHWTWAAAPSDVRAPQRESSGRIAATWYANSQFAIDVNLTDGAAHQVAVYVLDWDGGSSRAERIDIVDATTGSLLDSRTVSQFGGGQYLVWTLTGHVRIQVVRTGAYNSVVSAVFFGGAGPSAPSPTSATFVKADTTTQGAWKSSYGKDGYAIVGDVTRLPAYARLSVTGAESWTWAAASSDARAVQRETSGRVAATWYASSQFAIDVSLTDAAVHQIAVYIIDWDGGNARAERVEVVDAASGAVLDIRTVSHFAGGQYLVWNVTGDVRLKVVRTGAHNSVVSAVFFR